MTVHLSKKLQRCDQCRHEQAKHTIHAPDVGEFVGVGQMPAVQCQEKIALVDRCNGQVQGVSRRVSGHDVVRNVGGDQPQNFHSGVVMALRVRVRVTGAGGARLRRADAPQERFRHDYPACTV